MKNSISSIGLACFALTLSMPVAAQLRAAGNRPVMVVDANGKEMGRWDGQGDVVMAYGDNVVVVPLGSVSDSSLLTWASTLYSNVVYFNQPNCQGTAWGLGDHTPGALPTAVVGPDPQGHVLLYVSIDPTLRLIEEPTFHSFRDYQGCTTSTGTDAAFSYGTTTDIAPIDLAEHFTAPFHLH